MPRLTRHGTVAVHPYLPALVRRWSRRSGLRNVRHLGLPLIAVIQVDPKPANGPDATADTDYNHSTQETNP